MNFSESIVNENSNFQPKINSYINGPQNSSVAYLVHSLFGNNKTIPEMKGLTIPSGTQNIASTDLCFIINTIAPVKMKEFTFKKG